MSKQVLPLAQAGATMDERGLTDIEAHLAAMAKLTPVAGSGQLLTTTAAATNYTKDVAGGATYSFTANDGTFHLGVANTTANAANIIVTVPPAATRIFTMPAGQAILHFSGPTAGATGRLARLSQT